jgi:hypothetical protein
MIVRAMELESQADAHSALARAERIEAARLRSRAERITDPAKRVEIRKRSALERVRADGLLAAAAVEVEELARGFKAADLARQLGIRDESRAARLLLALEELGKVERDQRHAAMQDARAARSEKDRAKSAKPSGKAGRRRK